LGDGSKVDSFIPKPIYSEGVLKNKNIIKISAADTHNIILSSEGKIYGFGNNNEGEIGDGTIIEKLVPTETKMDGALNNVKISEITTGLFYFSSAVSNLGNIYSWVF
jgi:alpha-tubulin suppressor-like RCC1 family protein